eukprot:TRINITY_DN4180_c0_g1_i1.p1 TRINITY_DN4180_c0_g1~~TRINITY_DN4180_c0_g1_i1.p1  ORF type:complete len:640 (+),score=123.08 TRINITY_DN4180_c0_g1_i1:102-2021(+)
MNSSIQIKAIALLLCFFVPFATSFYLPGVAPREYDPDEPVDLKVNKLTSVHTQLPYGYYTLPFCAPNPIVDARENLGEHLAGDRIENSLYELRAKWQFPCRVLCNKTYNTDDIKLWAEKIKQEYRVHMIVDNLPAATPRTLTDAAGNLQEIYEAGYPLGDISLNEDGSKVLLLNNHLNIKMLYHENPIKYDGIRIVGFEIKAESINHDLNFDFTNADAFPNTCPTKDAVSAGPLVIDDKSTSTPVLWTYSVLWEHSDIPWSSRWDTYLMMTDDQIHWFSIINSLMIVLFLTGMVAMIMMRILRRDISSYKETESSEDPQEETGWKLVHGDVFRPPNHPILLAVSIGSGVQTLVMTMITMLFAVLGFLSPANRGGLTTAMVVLLVLMGLFAGYFSARLYKKFKGKAWKKTTLLTAFLYPGIDFALFIILNGICFGEKSSGAVPWYIMLELIALWFGISVPLTFLGAYFGYKKPIPDPPVRVHQIPRQIPEQIWYMKPLFSIMMGGILPFGAIFIELFFILSSIWLHQFYYLFGFLFIVFVILIITCAEITVVMCYFQLCAEDYKWWWRSFLTSGASAFYVFIYSIFYYFSKLEITSFLSGILYFGYTLIMALHFFLLTGTVGFYACSFFVHKIYSAIHVD